MQGLTDHISSTCSSHFRSDDVHVILFEGPVPSTLHGEVSCDRSAPKTIEYNVLDGTLRVCDKRVLATDTPLEERWYRKGLFEAFFYASNESCLDLRYFESLDTFLERKAYFEVFFCKADTAFFEVRQNEEKELIIQMHDETKLLAKFKHLGYDGGDRGVSRKRKRHTSFIKAWVNHSQLRFYYDFRFIPYSGLYDCARSKDSVVFNTFSGFSSSIDTTQHPTCRCEVLQPFFDLGRALCEGSDVCFSFMQKYIAHLIQYPEELTGLAFIIKGPQGTGKNVWLKAIANVIGVHHYYSSSNLDDIFGKHAEGAMFKLLVNLDECSSGKSTDRLQGRIKTFVTESRLKFNLKFVRGFDTKHYVRLFVTSNKEEPLKIDFKSGDRRWVAFTATREYVERTPDFWANLVNHFKSSEFITSFYLHFKQLDIKGWDYKKERIQSVLTETYKKLKDLQIDPLYHFLEEYLDQDLFDDWGEGLVYRVKRTEFCNLINKFMSQKNKTAGKMRFANNGTLTERLSVCSNCMITSVTIQGTGMFKFNPAELKCYIHETIHSEE